MSSLVARILAGTAVSMLVASCGVGCSSHSAASQAGMSSGANAAPAQPAAMSVPGVQRTATAADGLRAMADELSAARRTSGDTLAALQTLSAANGDLLEPFQRFMTLREQVEQDNQRIGQRGDDMRSRARDYITNWEVEVYGVEDKDLRGQAEQRRNTVRENYGRISDAMRSLREAFDPFRRQLQDIQTFLANDLTPAGVKAAAPSMQRATQAGHEVQRRIDVAITEVQRVASAMKPAVTQPASAKVLAPGYVAPAAAAQGNK